MNIIIFADVRATTVEVRMNPISRVARPLAKYTNSFLTPDEYALFSRSVRCYFSRSANGHCVFFLTPALSDRESFTSAAIHNTIVRERFFRSYDVLIVVWQRPVLWSGLRTYGWGITYSNYA